MKNISLNKLLKIGVFYLQNFELEAFTCFKTLAKITEIGINAFEEKIKQDLEMRPEPKCCIFAACKSTEKFFNILGLTGFDSKEVVM